MTVRASLLAVVVLSGWSSSASAYCRLTTSDANPEGRACVEEGRPLEWRRGCIGYSLEAMGSRFHTLEDARAVAGRSFGAWLAAACPEGPLPLQIVETEELVTCTRPEYDGDDGNSNVLSFRGDWPEEYSAGAFAITTVFHSRSTGEILDADIVINEEHFEWTICPERGCVRDESGEFTQVDFENVLTHEVGHFLGLAHSDRGGSVMDPGSPIGDTNNRVIRTDDRTGVCETYPPGTDYGECDFEPRGGFDPSCEGEGGCSAGAPIGGAGGFAALAALVLVRRGSRRT